MDAEAQRFGHTEAGAMLAKECYFWLEAPCDHGYIIPSNTNGVK
jgi:hypothetical protein